MSLRKGSWPAQVQSLAGGEKVGALYASAPKLAAGEYSRALHAQGGKCLLCGRDEPDNGFLVDTARTPAVLLCRPCFRTAHLLRTSPELRRAVQYVEETNNGY